MTENKQYFAKSKLANGLQPTVAEHLRSVAQEAVRFGASFGCGDAAQMAGQFHDFGKYSTRFQKVLTGEQTGIDHAFSSAALLYKLISGSKRLPQTYVPVIEAILAHHSGLNPLGDWENKFAESLQGAETEGHEGRISALTGEEYRAALEQFRKDFPYYQPARLEPFLPTSDGGVYQRNLEGMLYTRFLFSCLVDADYSVSANEEDPSYLLTSERSEYEPERLLHGLYEYRVSLCSQSTADSDLNHLRSRLFDQCGNMGDCQSGLFTLTAPTGTGKTLALLHFALRHCIKNGQRRIIIVLPYLTLTEQNAAVYRKIIPDLLEDHSQSKLDDVYREYAARWSVPVIITTSVRFFETLFASQPTDCRKLHSIANSVVVFDEAQSLPIQLTEVTLRAVKELCRSYNTTMVFSTATQPNFAAIQDLNWSPREIVPDYPEMFNQLRRVTVQWRIQEPTALEDIGKEMSGHKSVCTIVNLRRHASELYHALKELCPEEECFFLTTDLCPAHRTRVVQEVQKRLREHKPCRMVATQCIEAGVDLDFDNLYRALAPLESIVQAAGRCNRNGRRKDKGHVTVFLPEAGEGERLYPEAWYQLGADVVRDEVFRGGIDIHNPADIDRYYTRLFGMEQEKRNKKLIKAISEKDYQETDRSYRLIEDQGVRVIVPFAGERTLFDEIQAELRKNGEITPALMKRAAPITISCYDEKRLSHWAEALLLPKRKREGRETDRRSGWYLLSAKECYDSGKMGLHLKHERKLFL